MAKFHMQVPADVHQLVNVLTRLVGAPLGALKAGQIRGDQVSAWFVPTRGTSSVKRVKARLVRGTVEVAAGSPRRVYLDIRVQDTSESWWTLEDGDFEAAGLEPPHKYFGAEFVGVHYEWTSDGQWAEVCSSGCADCWHNRVEEYFRLLPGDRERALGEARRLAEEYNSR